MAVLIEVMFFIFYTSRRSFTAARQHFQRSVSTMTVVESSKIALKRFMTLLTSSNLVAG